MLNDESIAFLTTAATLSALIPRFWQYGDDIQVSKSLAPLLALHDAQHRAMFSRVTIRASLTMCSQVGRSPRLADGIENEIPQ
ncbi:MAG: hypothetical protein ACK5S3_10595 [Pirellulaceae bacterium]